MTTAPPLTRDTRRKRYHSPTTPMLRLAARLHDEGLSYRGCEIAMRVLYGWSPSAYTFRNHLPSRSAGNGGGVSKDTAANLPAVAA